MAHPTQGIPASALRTGLASRKARRIISEKAYHVISPEQLPAAGLRRGLSRGANESRAMHREPLVARRRRKMPRLATA